MIRITSPAKVMELPGGISSINDVQMTAYKASICERGISRISFRGYLCTCIYSYVSNNSHYNIATYIDCDAYVAATIGTPVFELCSYTSNIGLTIYRETLTNLTNLNWLNPQA